MKLLSILSISTLAVLALQSTPSFAYPGCYGCGYEDGAADGFIGGLLAAFASSYTTALANDPYYSETLLIEAANYEDTGAKGPVFQAFADQISADMTKQVGADEMSKLSQDQLDSMIAQRILSDSGK